MHVRACLILIAVCCVLAACASPEEEHVLRVMSFNIAAGNGDLDRIVKAIEAYDPDVVALQEVDVHWGERSDYQDQARYLGEALGMHYFFGEIYMLEPAEGSGAPRQYGLAFLSKEPFEYQENHHITRLSTLEEDPEPELLPGFPEVVVSIDGQRIHLFNTHLDYRSDPQVRSTQVDEVLAIMDKVQGPLLLLGDLNAEPGDSEIDPLFEVLEDAWKDQDGAGLTFPADDPVKRIDYILHSDHFRVSDAFVAEIEASDHRPVVADLVLD